MNSRRGCWGNSYSSCAKHWRLLENTLKKASRQSENIIIDLARIRIHQAKCIKELEKQFYKIKQIRKMLIVTKSKKVIDYTK
ncbi:MAG: hypothetical protein Q4A70_00410 [Candidatus Saccharibacteria bacterium]|nr:hypothetical protein [Candidatus Saccharibacteria bacterium]